jgi:hypothetical protein
MLANRASQGEPRNLQPGVYEPFEAFVWQTSTNRLNGRPGFHTIFALAGPIHSAAKSRWLGRSIKEVTHQIVKEQTAELQ